MLALNGYAQTTDNYSWHDVTGAFVQGRLSDEGIGLFNRLPDTLRDVVRNPVWRLSANSAGLFIKFRTKASDIKIRYQVEGSQSMSHMPATGVSGVDLYAFDNEKQWNWLRGVYRFNDTISYTYTNISPKKYKDREYYLYLPLYTSVKWLQIGIGQKDSLYLEKKDNKEVPVVVYGTSIAQGACATRPGMAWTNILSRKLDKPIVNLGFSGNGRLEEELVNYMALNTASVYVLDCMPNFTRNQQLGPGEAKIRLLRAISMLKEKHPDIPIVLVDHGGYADGDLQKEREEVYLQLNAVVREVYVQSKNKGIEGIYHLRKDEIGLDIDSFVDGTHPNDLGMMKYAEAYQKILLQVLN